MLAPRYRFENAKLFGAGTGSAAHLLLEVASISPDAAIAASGGH